MRRASYLAGVAALLVAGALALGSATFATSHALDPVFAAALRLSLWLHDAAGWTVGAALFVLAAARLGGRPMDAWVAAITAGVVITVASFNPSVPGRLALAATIVGALAPWFAIAFPPFWPRLAFVCLNLAVIVAAPAIASVAELPVWLRTFAPIDPLTIPAWLRPLPLQWPWIVVAAPIVEGFLVNAPTQCCVAVPVNSPIFAYVPAAIVGFVIWFRGRTRPEAQNARQGPAGRATRRG